MRLRRWRVVFLLGTALGCQSELPHTMPLRVMTYSIQHAAGGLDRIEAQIASYEPDIVCIQAAKKEGNTNQIEKLANYFGYYRAYGKAADLANGEEINGILSRYKVTDARVIDMPDDRNVGLLAKVAWPSQEIWVASISLTPNSRIDPIGLAQAETQRARQADRILAVTEEADGPVIVAGTLSSTPLSIVYQRMARRLTDCHFRLDVLAPPTYPNLIPAFRFDYVFASEQFSPEQAEISAAGPSDHRAVIVFLRLTPPETQPSATAWAYPFSR